jgi:Bacterial type II and III secretion system protein
MMRGSTLVLLLVVLVGCPEPGAAQSGKQVRVTFEFRQVGTQQRDAVDAGGRVVITDRGDARGGGRLGATSTERRVQTSTSIFTIVQDGGESTLLVASQVPYSHVAFYRDYLTGAGLVVAGVQWRDVGTALKVGATVLAGNEVKVRLTPTISWFSADKAGVIDVTQASTELVVPNGRPVVLGGATTQTHDLTRRILGYRATSGASETLMALTATVR